MSDLCMYEFGDIVWDEFCQNEDHIVPHPINEEASEHPFPGDSRKKPRHELIGLGIAREQSANKDTYQQRDKESISILENRKNIMLEKDSWSHTPNGVFPSSCDNNSVSSLASDGTRTSSHCLNSSPTKLIGNEFCITDSVLIDKSTAVDSNSYDYPLSPIPQTENDLSFFDNNRTDKDSSDFLYYGWPDIENFEDVDRMFRSCDSTFGLGASNDDDLGWFSSSDAIEESGDALNSEFKISCPASDTIEKNLENQESIARNETYRAINDSSSKGASVDCKNNSCLSDKDEPDTFGHLSLVNGTSSSDSKDDYRLRKQGVALTSEVQQKIPATNHSITGSSGMTSMHKKQQKHHNRSEVKRKDPYVSFYCNGSLPIEEKKLPPETTSQQTLPSGGIQQHKQALGSESFGCLQNNIPNMQSEYGHPSDQTSIFSTLSAVKSDSSGFTNISPKESSYSSNRVLSTESSHGPAFQVTSAVPSENREKLHHQQAFQSSFNSKAENVELGVQVPLCDPVSVETKVQHPGRKFENHANVEGVPGEYVSSTLQESSSVSSGLDEISLEAASFRQLQLVMEQLDLRTKLCIRDSLYRLAQSAEQRHNRANLKGSYCGDDRDATGVLVAEGTNKCTGYMDMETDTNPIDRSIAHLLFHRPSDSSVMPAQDFTSFKSPTPIHGSVSSPPLMPKKSGNDEGMAAETERNVADPDSKVLTKIT